MTTGKISGDPDLSPDGTEKYAVSRGGLNYGLLGSTLAGWLSGVAQTLTNKTIDAADNTISNLTKAMFVGGVMPSGAIVGSTDTQTLTNKTISGSTSVSVGNVSAAASLDVNANTSTSPALVVSTSVARIQAANSVSGGQEWVSYVGAGAGNILAGAVAGGTAASKTPCPSGAYLYNMRGYGWNGSAWSVGAIWIMKTTELWSATAQGAGHDWYTTPTGTTGLTNSMSLWASGGLDLGTAVDPGAGAFLANKSIKSRDSTAGIGYAAGAGGAVTQATNKSTGVTLNKVSGQITTNNAALAAGAVISFTLTNSAIAATDTVAVNLKSGNATAGTYRVHAEAIAAGSCVIVVTNISAGSLSETLVLNFNVIKGVNA